MLDLHRLRLLQEFAARGSIARTAAVLGYTPSAVSQQFAALEREAGTALPRAHPAASASGPVDLRALRHEPWLAAPAGEPSRQAVDRLLAAVGVAPPVLSEFEGMSTIVSLVARHRHRDPAAAGRRGGRPPGRGPGSAARPRPGQGRARGGLHRERTPSLGGGDRDRAARGGQGDARIRSPGTPARRSPAARRAVDLS